MSQIEYRKRIKESKARLDNELRSVAKGNPTLSVDELIALIREKHNVAITKEYAETLVRYQT